MPSVRDLKLTVIVVGFVLLLPIVIPLGLTLHAIGRHRLRAAARRYACPSCGQILGDRAIELADAAWEKFMRELREKHPDAKFRVTRTIDAICPQCGARLSFIEGDRSFEPTSDDFTGGPAGESNQVIRC